MKTHFNFWAMLLVVGVWVSCNSRTSNSNMNNQGADTTAMQGDNTAMNDNTANAMNGQIATDAEVLAMAMATDSNEINAANEAQGKQLSQPVMDYARMMIAEHTANLGKSTNIMQQIDNAATEHSAVAALKQKGQNTLATLRPLNGKEFERAYISAMVRDHQDALNMIDNQLLPAAQSEAVRTHLTEMRGHVAMHLERAKEIQENMQ